jgi:polyketide biosynthesis 3-hydroxy-3-methylglutaryl-CoA synthase-like enzyme PksG
VLAGGEFPEPRRIGVFSYGSGCCSEFYSGMATAEGARLVRALGIDRALAARRELDVAEYEVLLDTLTQPLFGQREARVDAGPFDAIMRSHFAGSGRLVLEGIAGYQRKYRWA